MKIIHGPQNIGIVANLNSPKSYAASINEIFENFNVKKEIFKNNLILAAERYHWDKEGEKIIKIYEELM